MLFVRSLLLLILLGMHVGGAHAQDPSAVVPFPDVMDSASAPSVSTELENLTPTGPLEKVTSNADALDRLLEATPESAPGWYEPSYWIRPTTWDGGVELGLNATEGNSESFSMRIGGNAKQETDTHSTAIDILYAKSTADAIETQNNARLKGRYDHALGESCWTLFAIGTMDYDEFRAFDLRLAGNGGFGYRFIKTDATTLTGRLGGGVSREIGGPDDRNIPEAVYGIDFERQLSKRQKLVVQSDYYPSWEDFDDYRLVTDVSWQCVLDEETNLNLKVSVLDQYDSTPNGREPNDLNYALLLLWTL